MMMNIIFAVLLALAVAMVVIGLAMDRAGVGAREIAKRLRRMGLPVEDGSDDVAIERDTGRGRVPLLDRLLKALKVAERLDLMLYQAGMTMHAGVLVALMAAFGMAGYMIGLIAFHRLFPAIVLMVTLVWLYVEFLRLLSKLQSRN